MFAWTVLGAQAVCGCVLLLRGLCLHTAHVRRYGGRFDALELAGKCYDSGINCPEKVRPLACEVTWSLGRAHARGSSAAQNQPLRTWWLFRAQESQGLCDTDASLTGSAGTCRRTCKDCIPCAQNDIICYRGNMKGRRKPLQGQRSGVGPDGAPSS